MKVMLYLYTITFKLLSFNFRWKMELNMTINDHATGSSLIRVVVEVQHDNRRRNIYSNFTPLTRHQAPVIFHHINISDNIQVCTNGACLRGDFEIMFVMFSLPNISSVFYSHGMKIAIKSEKQNIKLIFIIMYIVSIISLLPSNMSQA